MIDYKWKLCNGQTQQMFDHFKLITKHEEKELYAEGLIQNVQQCYLSSKDQQLTLYMEYNKESYQKYWESVIGKDRIAPQTTYYIQQYIEENNLFDDFHKFIEDNYHLFINYQSKQEKIKTLIDKVILPLFEESRGQYFFIYRDKDNRGIFIERPKDKNLADLLDLLEQFRKLLSSCIVNYDPESGDKKQILDMIKKISNFKEIYLLSPNDYKTLINLFERIKINLRRIFNPNPFLVQLNIFIDKIN